MGHKIDFNVASSEEVEQELGRRLESIRLQRNITQSQLAKEAGVSRSTITRLAKPDRGISLNSFIRLVKALQLQGHLEALLPEVEISPLVRLQLPSGERKRARPSKSAGSEWSWGDES